MSETRQPVPRYQPDSFVRPWGSVSRWSGIVEITGRMSNEERDESLCFGPLHADLDFHPKPTCPTPVLLGFGFRGFGGLNIFGTP